MGIKKKLFFFYCIVSIFFSCKHLKRSPSLCVEVAENYQYYFDKIQDTPYAMKFMKQLEEVSAKNNYCVSIHMLLADIYRTYGKNDEAKRELSILVGKNDKNAYVLFNLGLVYATEKNYDSAVLYFNNASQSKSNNNAYIIESTKEASIITGQKTFIDVRYTEIIYFKAMANFYRHHLLDAKREFEYCINNKEMVGQSYFYLGLIYLEIKEYGELCKNMIKAKENGASSDVDNYIKKYCESK